MGFSGGAGTPRAQARACWGSQRGPFPGPRAPSASAGRGPPRGSGGPTKSWKDGFRESLGANTPPLIPVHPVLRGPPQGLPDDAPALCSRVSQTPPGCALERTATCEQRGCRPPALTRCSSQRPRLLAAWAPPWPVAGLGRGAPGATASQPLLTLGQCPDPTRLHVPPVRTSFLGWSWGCTSLPRTAPSPVNPAPDKPSLALLSPGKASYRPPPWPHSSPLSPRRA